MFYGSYTGFGGHVGVSKYAPASAVMFDGAADYFRQIPKGSGSSQRIGTFSFWVKRIELGSYQTLLQQDWTGSGNEAILCRFNDDDTFTFRMENNSGSYLIDRTTTVKYRDPTAWAHFHITWDLNQAKQNHSCLITVNGVTLASGDFNSPSSPGGAQDGGFPNSGKIMAIGRHQANANHYLEAYLADVIYLDGAITTASTFGETDIKTGIWVPKDPSKGLTYSTYGSNVFASTMTVTANSGGTNLSNVLNGLSGGTNQGYNANGTNGWMKVDLGSGNEKTIESFFINYKQDDSHTSGFKINASNNDTDFTDLWTGTSISQAEGSNINYTFDNSTAYRYWRIEKTAGHASHNFNIWIWEAYEKTGTSSSFGTNGFWLPFSNGKALGADSSGNTGSTLISQNTNATNNEVNKGDMDTAGFTFGQRFQALADAAVPTAKFYASTTGFSGVTVRIETGTGTAPSGTLADSNGEVTSISSAGSGLKTITFPNGGPILTAGEWYWLVPAQTGTWGINHDYSTDGSYPNQTVGEYGMRHGSGWQGDQSAGHEVYQVGNHLEPVSMGYNNLRAESPVEKASKSITIYPTLDPTYNSSNLAYFRGNLEASGDGTGTELVRGTIPLDTGKWYWRVKVLQVQADGYPTIGIMNNDCDAQSADGWLGNSDNSWGVVTHADNGSHQGKTQHNNSVSAALTTNGTAAVAWAVGDYVDVALDADNSELWWGKNGTWLYKFGSTTQGVPSTRAEPHYSVDGDHWYPAASVYSDSLVIPQVEFDFTGGTAPSGFSKITNTVTGVSNHMTWNPLKPMTGTYSNGNLTANPAADKMCVGTHAFDYTDASGFYMEFVMTGHSSGYVGLIHTDQETVGIDSATPGTEHHYSFHSGTGTDQINDGGGTESDINAGVTWAANDVVQIACKNSDLWFGINNTWVNNGTGAGNPSTGANPCFTSMGGVVTTPVIPYAMAVSGVSTCTFTIHDGAMFPYVFSPPTGFKTLASHNLASNTYESSKYFQNKIYTGTGSTQSITWDGLSDMQPDFLWFKGRSGTRAHVLVDSIQGGATYIHSNATSMPTTASPNNVVTAFGTDGFTIGDISNINASTETFVVWGFKAGGAPTADNSGDRTPTDGSVMKGGSAITTSNYFATSTWYPTRMTIADHGGFSISKWSTGGSPAQGNTTPHGLSVIPQLVFQKSLSHTHGWRAGYMKRGTWNTGFLDGTSSFSTATSTSELASMDANHLTFGGNSNGYNNANATFIGYFFGNVPGVQRIGTYKGNNEASDNVFVYTGFRPALVMVRLLGGGGEWMMWDNKIDPYNDNTTFLSASSDGTETTRAHGTTNDNTIDFVSNGFKHRSNHPDAANDAEYLYMAFADNLYGSSFVDNIRAK